MTVSIITINRNNAAGLAVTMRSIAAQFAGLSHSMNIEHIIVDGMSSDGSLDTLLPELNSKIVVTEPRGIYNAVNTGLKMATGDILGLLHAGDVYASDNVLNCISDFFETHLETDFVWGDVVIGHRLYSGANFTPSSLSTGFAPPHPSLYMRRHIFEKKGLYDESYVIAADFEYFIRLFSDKSLSGRYLPVNMVRMQTGGSSQTLYNRLTTNNKERLRALSSHGLPAKRLRLMLHYKHIIKGFLCSSKKK